jgi:hypothetical protein
MTFLVKQVKRMLYAITQSRSASNVIPNVVSHPLITLVLVLLIILKVNYIQNAFKIMMNPKQLDKFSLSEIINKNTHELIYPYAC